MIFLLIFLIFFSAKCSGGEYTYFASIEYKEEPCFEVKSGITTGFIMAVDVCFHSKQKKEYKIVHTYMIDETENFMGAYLVTYNESCSDCSCSEEFSLANESYIIDFCEDREEYGSQQAMLGSLSEIYMYIHNATEEDESIHNVTFYRTINENGQQGVYCNSTLTYLYDSGIEEAIYYDQIIVGECNGKPGTYLYKSLCTGYTGGIYLHYYMYDDTCSGPGVFGHYYDDSDCIEFGDRNFYLFSYYCPIKCGDFFSDDKRVCNQIGVCGLGGKCDCSGVNYEGEFCEIPTCDPTCSTHGECKEDENDRLTHYCDCEEGWKGDDCGTSDDGDDDDKDDDDKDDDEGIAPKIIVGSFICAVLLFLNL